MRNVQKYEYKVVDNNYYFKCEQEAIKIYQEAGVNPFEERAYVKIIQWAERTFSIKFIPFASHSPLYISNDKLSEYTSGVEDPSESESLTDFVKFNLKLSYKKSISPKTLPFLCQERQYVSDVFSNKVDGFSCGTADNPVILFNDQNCFQRILYTILHELAHVFLHFKNPELYTLLRATDPLQPCSKEIEALEVEANIVASHLFISSNLLVQNIANEETFIEIMNESNMSNSALFNRIKDLLFHGTTLGYSHVLESVIKYRDGDINSIWNEIVPMSWEYC